MLVQSKISLWPGLTAAWEKQKESPFYFSSVSAQLKHPKLPEVICTSIQRAEGVTRTISWMSPIAESNASAGRWLARRQPNSKHQNPWESGTNETEKSHRHMGSSEESSPGN